MATPLNILIVEDSPDDADLLVAELRRAGFIPEWKRVETEADFLAEIKNAPDIILSDYAMPQFNGLRAAELLQATGLNIPFILISGTVGEDVAVEAMKRGATDYLLKDRLARLGQAVNQAREQRRLREETRRAEVALYQSEHKYRHLFESLSEAAFLIDGELLRILDANPGAERLLGQTRSEIVGMNAEKLFPVEDAKRRCRELASLGNGQRGQFDDASIQTKAGRIIPVRMSFAPVELHRRGLVLALVTDITERRIAEMELRRREERFRLLIENAADLITVVNGEGIIGFQSASAERVLGTKPEELVGRSIFRFVHPEDTARVVAALQRAIAERAVPVPVEFRFQHRNGTWRTIQSIGRSIAGEEGGNSVVINSRDITEEKNLEAQLRQSQKLEAFGQLAGGVAHDFNNLLTVISGHCELLLMPSSSDCPAQDSLAEIRKAGERASALTRQLLAFSRQQVLEPRVVSLNTIVTETKNMLGRLIGEDVVLVCNLSPDLHPVKVDPGQMDQVILNLAVNARDAMPRGGKIVIATRNVGLDGAQVASRPDLRPGNYAMLAVSDNGCGMTAEVQAHIFEPFFTTKGVGKGTGLGLAVVHGIVKQSEGHIEVESEVGVGTTFKICFPAVQGRPTRTSDTVVLREAHGRETILLVEDEDSVRQFAATALQRFGYTVLKAADGKSALEMMTDGGKMFDLLLTDLVMPGISGRELAETFGRRFPGLKVLYLSGYTDDAIIRHGVLEAGAAFLQKPFTPHSLAKKVREVMDQR